MNTLRKQIKKKKKSPVASGKTEGKTAESWTLQAMQCRGHSYFILLSDWLFLLSD